MHFNEATAMVSKLQAYQGKIMKPFSAPVKNFLIVPANQLAFDNMFKNMQDNGTPFPEAIKPYEDNVTVLACFDVVVKGDEVRYCYYDYFLFDNNISV